MGWASGTDFFDGALDIFLPYVPEGQRAEVIEKWYDVIADGDWDTESESEYWSYLWPIMEKRGLL